MFVSGPTLSANYNNRQGQKHIFILKVVPVTGIHVYHIQSNEIQENID